MATLKNRTIPRKKGNEKKEIKKDFFGRGQSIFFVSNYTHWVISGYLLLFVVIFKNVKKKIKTEFGCLTPLQTPN